MKIETSNTLALLGLRMIRFIQDFSGRDFAWLLIGALMALLVFWVVSRRRRRWF